MQLFIIDKDPFKAAHALADCHVRKQILETAQILTAYWVNSGHERLEWMPKPQNYNHPVAKAINQENVRWVIEHFHELSADHFSAAVSGGICAEHRGDGAAADRLGAGVVDFDGSAASGYFHGEHRQICGGG